MNTEPDQRLVRAYAELRSETAFAELVRRHVDLVYSAALRIVRDPHLAEDVTQGVFVALGQNARKLTDRPVLSGWLHRTTHNLAANAVRSEVRRRAREQDAAAMNQLLSTGSNADWDRVAPHLDAALAELSDADCDALLLRYFQRKSAREIGSILGLSDEAAQKRVTRAVERLRDVIASRGVTVTGTALVGVLSLHAVQSAPAALVASVAAAALVAGAAVPAVSTLNLLTLMTSIKLKLGLAALAVAGVTTTVVLQHQRNEQLLAENAALREQAAQSDSLRTTVKDEEGREKRETNDTEELAHLRKEHAELLRLRDEAARLRDALGASASAPTGVVPVNAPPPQSVDGDAAKLIPFTSSVNARVRDGESFATGGWSSSPGNRTFYIVTPHKEISDTGIASVLLATTLIEIPEENLPGVLLKQVTGESRESTVALSGPAVDALTAAYALGGRTNFLSAPRILTLDGRQAQVMVGNDVNLPGNEPRFIGTKVDLLPRLSEDGQAIDISLNLQYVPDDAAAP